MPDVGTHEAVASYLTSLRAALADLPPAEVEEILDDVGPHVAEVAQELGDEDLAQRLRERLGEPEQYAAELRAAAGYPPSPSGRPAEPPARRRAALRLALWLLVAATVLAPLAAVVLGTGVLVHPASLLVPAVPAALSLIIVLRSPGGIAAFTELPEVRWLRARTPGGAVADYGRLLQPGWWLVRAGVAALLVMVLLDVRPTAFLLVLVTLPLAIGSIWLGRRSQADRRWLWAVLPLNAFAVVAGLALIERVPLGEFAYLDYRSPEVVEAPMFTNIYPYDANGRPLSGVYLYDENGQPITPRYSVSECTPANRIPVPANQYPQPVYEYDSFKVECVLRSTTPTPSQLPTPTPTTTVTPSLPTPTG